MGAAIVSVLPASMVQDWEAPIAMAPLPLMVAVLFASTPLPSKVSVLAAVVVVPKAWPSTPVKIKPAALLGPESVSVPAVSPPICSMLGVVSNSA